MLRTFVLFALPLSFAHGHHPLGESDLSDEVRKDLHRLFLVYQLYERHRKFGSSEENAAMHEIFTDLATDMIRRTLARRMMGESPVSGAKLLEILTAFRLEVGDRSNVTWAAILGRIKGKLPEGVEESLREAAASRANFTMLLGLGGGLVGGLAALPATAGFPVGLAGTAIGSAVITRLIARSFFGPRIGRKALREVDAFVLECEDRFVLAGVPLRSDFQ